MSNHDFCVVLLCHNRRTDFSLASRFDLSCRNVAWQKLQIIRLCKDGGNRYLSFKWRKVAIYLKWRFK